MLLNNLELLTQTRLEQDLNYLPKSGIQDTNWIKTYRVKKVLFGTANTFTHTRNPSWYMR